MTVFKGRPLINSTLSFMAKNPKAPSTKQPGIGEQAAYKETDKDVKSRLPMKSAQYRSRDNSGSGEQLKSSYRSKN